MQDTESRMQQGKTSEKIEKQGFRVPSQAGDYEEEKSDQGENSENRIIEEEQQSEIQAAEGLIVERKPSAHGQMLFWGMLFLCGSIFAGGVYRVSKRYGKRRSARLLRW